MRALILCDGSEGSLRCVEAACAAPAAAPHAADASLVFLHVWDAPVKPHSAAAGGDASSAAGAAHSSHKDSTMQTSAAAAAAAAVSEAVSAAASPSTEAPAATGAHVTATLSCAEVLTATLRAVHVNKYVKGRAHYCVETVCATAIDATNADSNTTPTYLLPASTPPVPDGPDAASRRLSLTASVNAPNFNAADVGGVSMAVSPVVRHAAARAAFHHVEAVFLGVGQRQEGKLCRVGTVAAAALQCLRCTYPLYYVKKDGVKWRPAPLAATGAGATTATVAAIRFSIVVPMPPSASKAAHGNAEKLFKEAGVVAALQYVQQHCVRTTAAAAVAAAPVSVDSVGFLVIAPSSSSSGAEAEEDAGLEAASTRAADNKDAAGLCAYKQYLESLLSPVAPVANQTATQDSEANPAAPVVAVAAEGEERVEKDSSEVGSAAPASRVVVCTLKPTKKHPHVTLENTEVALPQIVKQITALKPDVLVMPASLVPDALQLAMLTTGKPHCVILPC